MNDPDSELDPGFQKEEWFSFTLLEWGRCGKLLLEDDEGRGFAQYGPATFFAGLARFPWARISDDAAFLSSCYVQEGHRGRGFGSELVRTVARDLVDRGYRAVESVGDRSQPGGELVLDQVGQTLPRRREGHLVPVVQAERAFGTGVVVAVQVQGQQGLGPPLVRDPGPLRRG